MSTHNRREKEGNYVAVENVMLPQITIFCFHYQGNEKTMHLVPWIICFAFADLIQQIFATFVPLISIE